MFNVEDFGELNDTPVVMEVPADRLHEAVAKEVELAPSMELQAKEIAEAFLEFPELNYENWKELCSEERLNVLQSFETEIARIEHRDPLVVRQADLGQCVRGQCSWHTGELLVNTDMLGSDSREDYVQSLTTFIHEGRHAYQFHNLYVEAVEPNKELLDSWHVNLDVLGYDSGDHIFFGFEKYYTQPIEVDARVFAQATIKNMDLR